jgi:transcriptional regulator with XRE-family HTH domain
MNTTAKPKHIGRNISRIREMRQMKQEALAYAIGVSQQTISNIENSESVDEEKLIAIAEALGVTKEALQNFNEDVMFNFFNSFNDADFTNSNGAFGSIACTFNPLDKVVELYERLVQAEKDKVTYLEKLLNK